MQTRLVCFFLSNRVSMPHNVKGREADTLKEGLWSQDGYHPEGWPGTFRICILYWRPWKFGWRWHDIYEVSQDFLSTQYSRRGLVSVFRARFLVQNRTSRLLLEPSFFHVWRRGCAWLTCVLWTCLVFSRQFSIPLIRTSASMHPRSPILHHHVVR